MSDTSPDQSLLARVIAALGETIKDTRIAGESERAYTTVPDPLALKARMAIVESELNVDIHCVVHVEQHHAMLLVTPR